MSLTAKYIHQWTSLPILNPMQLDSQTAEFGMAVICLFLVLLKIKSQVRFLRSEHSFQFMRKAI